MMKKTTHKEKNVANKTSHGEKSRKGLQTLKNNVCPSFIRRKMYPMLSMIFECLHVTIMSPFRFGALKSRATKESLKISNAGMLNDCNVQ